MSASQSQAVGVNPAFLGDKAYELVQVDASQRQIVETFVAKSVGYRKPSRNFVDSGDLVFFSQEDEAAAASSSGRQVKSRQDFIADNLTTEQVTAAYQHYKDEEQNTFKQTLYFQQLTQLFAYIKDKLLPCYINDKKEVDKLVKNIDDFLRKFPSVEWNNALSFSELDSLKHDVEVNSSFLAGVAADKRQYYRSSLVKLINYLGYCATGVISKQASLRVDLYLGDGVPALLQTMREDIVNEICRQYRLIKSIKDNVEEHLRPLFIGNSDAARNGQGLGLLDVKKNKMASLADPYLNELKIDQDNHLLGELQPIAWFEQQFHHYFNFFQVVSRVTQFYQEKYYAIISNDALDDGSKIDQLTQLFKFYSRYDIQFSVSDLYYEVEDSEDEFIVICIYKKNITHLLTKPVMDYLIAEDIITKQVEIEVALELTDAGIAFSFVTSDQNDVFTFYARDLIKSNFSLYGLELNEVSEKAQFNLAPNQAYLFLLVVLAHRDNLRINNEKLVAFIANCQQQQILNQDQVDALKRLIENQINPMGQCLFLNEEEVAIFIDKAIEVETVIQEYHQRVNTSAVRLTQLGCQLDGEKNLVKQEIDFALIPVVNRFYAKKQISEEKHSLLIDIMSYQMANDEFKQLIEQGNIEQLIVRATDIDHARRELRNAPLIVRSQGCEVNQAGKIIDKPITNPLLAYDKNVSVCDKMYDGAINTKLTDLLAILCADLNTSVHFSFNVSGNDLSITFNSDSELSTLYAVNEVKMYFSQINLDFSDSTSQKNTLVIASNQSYLILLVILSLIDKSHLDKGECQAAVNSFYQQKLLSDDQVYWLNYFIGENINPQDTCLLTTEQQVEEFIDKAISIERAIKHYHDYNNNNLDALIALGCRFDEEGKLLAQPLTNPMLVYHGNTSLFHQLMTLDNNSIAAKLSDLIDLIVANNKIYQSEIMMHLAEDKLVLVLAPAKPNELFFWYIMDKVQTRLKQYQSEFNISSEHQGSIVINTNDAYLLLLVLISLSKECALNETKLVDSINWCRQQKIISQQQVDYLTWLMATDNNPLECILASHGQMDSYLDKAIALEAAQMHYRESGSEDKSQLEQLGCQFNQQGLIVSYSMPNIMQVVLPDISGNRSLANKLFELSLLMLVNGKTESQLACSYQDEAFSLTVENSEEFLQDKYMFSSCAFVCIKKLLAQYDITPIECIDEINQFSFDNEQFYQVALLLVTLKNQLNVPQQFYETIINFARDKEILSVEQFHCLNYLLLQDDINIDNYLLTESQQIDCFLERATAIETKIMHFHQGDESVIPDLQTLGCQFIQDGGIISQPVTNPMLIFYKKETLGKNLSLNPYGERHRKFNKLVNLIVKNNKNLTVSVELIKEADSLHLTLMVQPQSDLFSFFINGEIKKLFNEFDMRIDVESSHSTVIKMSTKQCYLMFLLILTLQDKYGFDNQSMSNAISYCCDNQLLSPVQESWLSRLQQQKLQPFEVCIFQSENKTYSFLDRAIAIERAIERFNKEQASKDELVSLGVKFDQQGHIIDYPLTNPSLVIVSGHYGSYSKETFHLSDYANLFRYNLDKPSFTLIEKINLLVKLIVNNNTFSLHVDLLKQKFLADYVANSSLQAISNDSICYDLNIKYKELAKGAKRLLSDDTAAEGVIGQFKQQADLIMQDNCNYVIKLVRLIKLIEQFSELKCSKEEQRFFHNAFIKLFGAIKSSASMYGELEIDYHLSDERMTYIKKSLVDMLLNLIEKFTDYIGKDKLKQFALLQQLFAKKFSYHLLWQQLSQGELTGLITQLVYFANFYGNHNLTKGLLLLNHVCYHLMPHQSLMLPLTQDDISSNDMQFLLDAEQAFMTPIESLNNSSEMTVLTESLLHVFHLMRARQYHEKLINSLSELIQSKEGKVEESLLALLKLSECKLAELPDVTDSLKQVVSEVYQMIELFLTNQDEQGQASLASLQQNYGIDYQLLIPAVKSLMAVDTDVATHVAKVKKTYLATGLVSKIQFFERQGNISPQLFDCFTVHYNTLLLQYGSITIVHKESSGTIQINSQCSKTIKELNGQFSKQGIVCQLSEKNTQLTLVTIPAELSRKILLSVLSRKKGIAEHFDTQATIHLVLLERYTDTMNGAFELCRKQIIQNPRDGFCAIEQGFMRAKINYRLHARDASDTYIELDNADKEIVFFFIDRRSWKYFSYHLKQVIENITWSEQSKQHKSIELMLLGEDGEYSLAEINNDLADMMKQVNLTIEVNLTQQVEGAQCLDYITQRQQQLSCELLSSEQPSVAAASSS